MASNTELFQDSGEFFKVLLSHLTQSTLISGHADYPGHNTNVMLLYAQKYAHILLHETYSIRNLKKKWKFYFGKRKRNHLEKDL